MSKRLTLSALVVVAVFATAQLVRPDRTNPPTSAGRTIQASAGTSSGLVAVLDRACGDCHSNGTVWPSYTRIAPVSWLMAYTVAEGRKVVNFSEWAAYTPERQRMLLIESCQAASAGKMPGSAWTTLHPEARLSTQDIDTICSATPQTGAPVTGVTR